MVGILLIVSIIKELLIDSVVNDIRGDCVVRETSCSVCHTFH